MTQFWQGRKSVICNEMNSKLVWWNYVSIWLLNSPVFITTAIILLPVMAAKISKFEYARTNLWRCNFCGLTRTLVMTVYMTEWNLNVTLCGPLTVYCFGFCDKCLLKQCSIWYWSNPILKMFFYSWSLRKIYDAWWRHQMQTFSALLAIYARNSPVTGEFPAQRPVTHSFNVFFDLRLNKRLNKQSWGWWFETPSRPLWRHCNWMLRTSL